MFVPYSPPRTKPKMLIERQIQKLRALTVSQKFGKLIEDAITTWSSGIDFVFKAYGIVGKTNVRHSVEDNNYEEIGTEIYELKTGKNQTPCCYLLGAALVGKETFAGEGYCLSIKRIYGEDLDPNQIYHGFDYNQNLVDRYENDEDFMFGNKVRKILLNED